MYKLRSSVSVIDNGEGVLEFFKTSTRKAIRIKTNSDLIKRIVLRLDGNTSVSELANEFGISEESEELSNLFSYLKRKAILSNDEKIVNCAEYTRFRRVIHFLEDYSESDEDLIAMWKSIRNSHVLIVGIGAVGSWVAINLAQSGVLNFTIMDNDCVDYSNLHRQYGFKECDVGRKKTDVLAERLKEFDKDIKVKGVNEFLDEKTLYSLEDKYDLVINCADKPTVDQTSLWIGEYCMKKLIPHIVGGGYNLHLSLVGQTIIPYKTACAKCFERQLEQINRIDGYNIKKLQIKNRKIGSFGPMCTIIASMIGMEAIKVLTKKIPPKNINRRGEFDINDMSLTYKDFAKLDECEWCGKNEGNRGL